MNHTIEEVEASLLDDVGCPLSPEQQCIVEQAGDSVLPASLLLARITGNLDLAGLGNALNAVCQRHTILGARLKKVPGYLGYRQTETPPDHLSAIIRNMLAVESGTGDVFGHKINSNDDAWGNFVDKAKTVQRSGFGPGEFPMFNVIVSRTGENEHGLAFIACDILTDRAGLLCFWRALMSAYHDGPDLSLADDEVSPQYSHYAEWREDLAGDDNMARGREYWCRHLADAESEPVLPFRVKTTLNSNDNARPISVTHLLGQHERDQLAQLSTVTRQPAVLATQALWWWLLAKISLQEKMLVGWRHDCRSDYQYFSNTIGVFDKILPLNLAVDHTDNFVEWVAQLANLHETHRAWQESWSQADPLAQYHTSVGFFVRETLAGNDGWTLQEVDSNTSVFDLSLSIKQEPPEQESDSKVEGGTSGWEINARPDCFCPRDIDVLSEQYATLLQRVLENPYLSFNELSPIGDKELRRLQRLDNIDRSFSDQCSFEPIPRRIAEWAVSSPDAVALNDGNSTLSYAELEQKIRLIAARLADDYGVSQNDVVALLLPRTVDLLIAILAVWRLGAAWVPIDNQWPQIRKEQVLAVSKSVLVVTESGFTSMDESVPGDQPLCYIDRHLAEAAHLTSEDSPLDMERFSIDSLFHDDDDSRRVAYIIFTSGSTGEPKGVVIEHRQLANYIAAASRDLALAESRQFAMVSTVAADLGHTTMFGGLFNGGTLHLATDEAVKDGEQFIQFLQSRKIDCLKIVPSHLLALLDSSVFTPADSEISRSVSLQPPLRLILGGEAIPARLVDLVYRIWPDVQLYNHYGPTETTVGVLYHPITADDPQGVRLSQVFDGNRVYVLGKDLRRTPTGCLGQLYIGGDQLCRGYLNAGQDKAFIEDPFHPGQRLYGSGDLARYLPDGSLQIAGRCDHQVKVRGFRIELLEVEQALLSHTDIALAVASVWTPDSASDAERQLVAYVVSAQGAKTDTGTLDRVRSYLAERLPGYMLPVHLFGLEDMPRLPNGKIDRNNLPRPEMLLRKESIREPESALERLIMEEMARLLNQPRISTDRSFFAIGGHSLLVVKLAARLKKQLHIQLGPGLVFDYPSVIELASAMYYCLDSHGEPVVEKLERTAQLRLTLNSLSPEERDALLAQVGDSI